MPDQPVQLVNPVVRRWQRDAARTRTASGPARPPSCRGSGPGTRCFDWQPPTFRWFIGGETNLAYNAVDRHVKRAAAARRRSSPSTSAASATSYTYAQLLTR